VIESEDASISADSSGNFGVCSLPLPCASGNNHSSGPMFSGPPHPAIKEAGSASVVVPVSNDRTEMSLGEYPSASAVTIADIDGLFANSPPSAQYPRSALVGLNGGK